MDGDKMQVCNIQTLFYLSCRVFCEYNIGVPAQGGVVAPPPPNFDKKYSAYSLA
jgi:hypothetical protein